MATDRPEYFYHPALGVISPGSLELFRLNTAKAVPAEVAIVPAPDLESSPVPASTSSSDTGPAAKSDAQTSQILPAQIGDVLPPNTIMPRENPPMPRKALNLQRTEKCVVTGEDLPVHDLIRFVISPDRHVLPDFTDKLPGQAFFIKADLSTLKKALWRNTFTSVAKDSVTVPDNLLDMIKSGLARQAFETLNLARRAGELIIGFAKIEEELRKAPSGVYVVASDASDHGRLKLAKLAKNLPILDLWTCDELSRGLNEANTNHILLSPGGLAEKLSRIATKLKAVRD